MTLACTIEKPVGAYANSHQFASTSTVLPFPFPRTTAASPLKNNTRNQLYSKIVFANLYTTKTPITSADLLNDPVLSFFAEQGMGMLRILTDRGTEYCGLAETHDYQLYLAINDIEHTKTKAASPQSNGICERFHKTILQEFYQVAFRRKIYLTLEELQQDLDEWIDYYNTRFTYQ